MSLAVAPSCRHSYTAACNEFFKFQEEEGLGQDWPPLDNHTMQFVVHLHCNGLALWLIQGQMFALAFYTKVQGCRGYFVD